jgi:hypothetical protein
MLELADHHGRFLRRRVLDLGLSVGVAVPGERDGREEENEYDATVM